MCLRKPAAVVFTAILVLIVTVALSLTLTMNTLKEIEADTFNVYMTFPNGNTLNRTDETIKAYEERLNDIRKSNNTVQRSIPRMPVSPSN